ncbi:19338_t:CDS:2 [Gigaspora margarita]|uniref:19338_t:CDS:1 n=1 Tax=Gigaspora margarita TaxID=4874 RepID=A0ABN7V5F0_GIGMA|nr:19338_t:CDS:2 [Gigaspora margarita]
MPSIRTYPIGLKDNEVEVVLYVLCNHDEWDPDSQAMIRRDEYYSVGGRIILNRYARNVRPKAPIIQTLSLTTSSNIESEPSIKHKRSEEIDQLIDIDFIGKPEKPIKKPKSLKNSTRPPIKERPIRTIHSPKKSCHTTIEDAKSDKE